MRRRDVIVPPSPIVPRNEDRGIAPVGARTERVDDRRDPRGAGTVRRSRMVGGGGRRCDPDHVGQIAVRDIGQHRRRRRDHVGRVRAALADVRDGVRCVPKARRDAREIIPPAHRFAIEQIHEGGAVETGIGPLIFVADLVDQPYERSDRGIAAAGEAAVRIECVSCRAQRRPIGDR